MEFLGLPSVSGILLGTSVVLAAGVGYQEFRVTNKEKIINNLTVDLEKANQTAKSYKETGETFNVLLETCQQTGGLDPDGLKTFILNRENWLLIDEGENNNEN